MADNDQDMTIGEVGRFLQRLDEGQKALIDEIKGLGKQFVARTEWDQFKTYVDEKFTDLAAKTAPRAPTSGWVIAGVVISALVGIGSLLGVLITLIRIIPAIEH